MNFNVSIDWRFTIAFGIATVCTIFAVKMDADAAERVSTEMVEAFKEFAISLKGS